MRHPHPLSDERLRSLSTHRLLQVLKYARRNLEGRTCDSCSQDLETCLRSRDRFEEADLEKRDWEETLAYLTKVKALLATREHVEKVS